MNRILERLPPFVRKIFTREFLMYIICGFGTTFVNLFLFYILSWTTIDYKWANLIAIVSAKIFAYATNKILVFQTHTENLLELLKEMFRFVIVRGATGVIDYFGLIFAVEAMGLPSMVSKYALQFIIIVLNYILGKRHVFRKKKQEEVSK